MENEKGTKKMYKREANGASGEIELRGGDVESYKCRVR